MSSAADLVRNDIPRAVPQFTLSEDLRTSSTDAEGASQARVKEVVVGISDLDRLSSAATLLHSRCGQMELVNVWQCPDPTGVAVRLLPSSNSSIVFQVTS